MFYFKQKETSKNPVLCITSSNPDHAVCHQRSVVVDVTG